MRLGSLTAAALLSGLVATLATPSRAQTPAPRTPVIVELFTSEGCSDCPPADDVLTKLAAQPIPGAEVIALGEHVDYWDNQGWRDPFSSPAFTRRQIEYTQALRVESPYTPQMIVNGLDEFVGSNYADAAKAISKAARAAGRQLRVELAADAVQGRAIPVHVSVDAPEGVTLKNAADVLVALTEDGLESDVERGENRGRHLRHVAVVRSLARIGGIPAGGRHWSGAGEIALDRQWNVRSLHVAAFVQDHGGREIVGAASSPIR